MTKEQIAHQIMMQNKSKQFKAFVKEKLYPLLQKHTDSLPHAQQSCEVFKTVILQAMNKHWEGKTVSALGLKEELTKEEGVKDVELHMGLIEMLDDVPLGDAQQVLEGMMHALAGIATKESEKIVLKDIPVTQIIND